MATYVALFNWTDQGIRTASDSVQRVEQARAAFEALGVRLSTIYWTQGRHDFVGILDAPDDDAVAATMLQLDRLSNV